MQIYYGSNVIVNQPKIITDGFYKDLDMDSIVRILKNKLKDGR